MRFFFFCKIVFLLLLLYASQEKDLKGNVRPPVYLVPELCNMTGLSEEQRGDFNLMRDLGEYTRYRIVLSIPE